MFNKKLITALVLGGLMFLMVAGGSALAGNNSATTSTPAITVSPGQVPMGATSVVISGSGFSANRGIYVGIWGGTSTDYVVTDGNGGFSLTYTPGGGSFDTASPYTAVAFTFKGHRLVSLAETQFTVCSTNPC